MTYIQSSSVSFLEKLEKNNNRDWFNSNKELYLKERDKLISFADQLLALINKHDHIENINGKKCLLRIYRDVRFSKNKLPYKTHWALSFTRATNLLRGGYYVHIQANASFVGLGFWNPNPEDLKRIRQQFSIFGYEFLEILSNEKFIHTFSEMKGTQLKNGPKGFDKQDKYIDLLKYKQFLITKTFSDKEVLSENFLENINETFKTARPFLNFFSEALTTNLNGESIVQ